MNPIVTSKTLYRLQNLFNNISFDHTSKIPHSLE